MRYDNIAGAFQQEYNLSDYSHKKGSLTDSDIEIITKKINDKGYDCTLGPSSYSSFCGHFTYKIKEWIISLIKKHYDYDPRAFSVDHAMNFMSENKESIIKSLNIENAPHALAIKFTEDYASKFRLSNDDRGKSGSYTSSYIAKWIAAAICILIVVIWALFIVANVIILLIILSRHGKKIPYIAYIYTLLPVVGTFYLLDMLLM